MRETLNVGVNGLKRAEVGVGVNGTRRWSSEESETGLRCRTKGGGRLASLQRCVVKVFSAQERSEEEVEGQGSVREVTEEEAEDEMDET